MIVVDHHKCAAELPGRATRWSTPTGSTRPRARRTAHLAAVGVAFLLGAALLRTLRARGFFADRAEPRLIDLLDIVALGTVADVARLTGSTARSWRRG